MLSTTMSRQKIRAPWKRHPATRSHARGIHCLLILRAFRQRKTKTLAIAGCMAARYSDGRHTSKWVRLGEKDANDPSKTSSDKYTDGPRAEYFRSCCEYTGTYAGSGKCVDKTNDKHNDAPAEDTGALETASGVDPTEGSDFDDAMQDLDDDDTFDPR